MNKNYNTQASFESWTELSDYRVQNSLALYKDNPASSKSGAFSIHSTPDVARKMLPTKNINNVTSNFQALDDGF